MREASPHGLRRVVAPIALNENVLRDVLQRILHLVAIRSAWHGG
jgi:hypothetical protein